MIGTPFPVGAGPRRFFDTTVSCFGIKTLISEFPFLRKRKSLTHPNWRRSNAEHLCSGSRRRHAHSRGNEHCRAVFPPCPAWRNNLYSGRDGRRKRVCLVRHLTARRCFAWRIPLPLKHRSSGSTGSPLNFLMRWTTGWRILQSPDAMRIGLPTFIPRV